MGDVSTGLAYLCCCMRDPNDPINASRIRDGAVPDPREREIDKMFMKRDYKRDAAGRFVKIRQPAPTGAMAVGMPARGESGGSDYVDGMTSAQYLKVPQIAVTDSTSTSGSSVSQTKEPIDSVMTEPLPALT